MAPGRTFGGEFQREVVRLVKEQDVAIMPAAATWIYTRTCCAKECGNRRLIRGMRSRAKGR